MFSRMNGKKSYVNAMVIVVTRKSRTKREDEFMK